MGIQNINSAVKDTLLDIIDFCYKGKVSNAELSNYKDFSLELSGKTFSSIGGDYNIITHRMRIVNLDRFSNANIIIVLLHELSHHIELMETGDTGHGKRFYEIHLKLLFAAFDMNVISYDEFIEVSKEKVFQNTNKLKNMVIKSYKPHPVSYHSTENWIIINDIPKLTNKSKIQQRGYWYNSVAKKYQKICSNEELNKETDYLDENYIGHSIKPASNIIVNPLSIKETIFIW